MLEVVKSSNPIDGIVVIGKLYPKYYRFLKKYLDIWSEIRNWPFYLVLLDTNFLLSVVSKIWKHFLILKMFTFCTIYQTRKIFAERWIYISYSIFLSCSIELLVFALFYFLQNDLIITSFFSDQFLLGIMRDKVFRNF